MIKYIIHLADIHVRAYAFHDLYKEQFNRTLEDVKNTLFSMDPHLTTQQIRVVIAGDIVHQKISISNEQIMLTSWFIRELSKIGKVIILPGNHDFLENNTQRMDSITPVVELLDISDVSYFKDGGVYPDENINWVVYSLYDHNKRPDFEKEVGKKYVGLFHGPVQGLSTDLGFVFEDGYDQLNFVGLDIVLCGDIHKRQVFKIPGGGKGVMIGSLIQQNFGETVKNHGYGIYDVAADNYVFRDIESSEPFLHYKITDIKDIEDGGEKHLNLG